MRQSLRHSRRRVTAAVAAVVASAALLAVPQASADDLKDKQRQNKEQIEDAQHDLHSSSKQMARATARLADARTQLSRAQGVLAAADAKVDAAEVRDAEMQAALDQAVSELRRARRELARGRARMNVQQEQVAATITEYYQAGDPALIAFASLLEAGTPADLTRQSEMADAIVDREAHSYQELLASEVLLDVHEAQVEEAKEDVEDKREEAAAHLKAMEGLRTAAQQARDQVSALVSKRRTASQRAARARASDQQALAQLKREEDRIARQLARRAARLARQASRRGNRAKPSPSSGVLSSPVSGATMTSPYGYRRHPIYGYWGMHDGQDWAAGCGSPLYATAGGRISSSYYSEVYGNRLVLDHGLLAGVGLASIYNHATHYTVRPGQRVKRGQVIGYVGSTGWSTGCHLHFTVMVNGKTADPRSWL